MIVDTSAVIAILRGEPRRTCWLTRILSQVAR